MTPSTLDQLRPNHLPDPVSFWPPAPGWWIVLVLILLAVFLTVVILHLGKRRDRYRQQALQKADALLDEYHHHGDNRRCMEECNRLLKQTALHAYPDRNIAPLFGQPWIDFLNSTAGIQMDTTTQKWLLEQHYRPVAAREAGQQEHPAEKESLLVFHQLTLDWIRKHHA